MLEEPLNLSYRDAQGVYRAIITRATLIAVASDESTPPDQLAAFAACEDIDVRRALANNRGAPSLALDIISNDPALVIKYDVSKNPNTSGDTLTKLANDTDPRIRAAVAANSMTPEDVLIQLATDNEAIVRSRVAQNQSIPLASISFLWDDPDPEVRRALKDRTTEANDSPE